MNNTIYGGTTVTPTPLSKTDLNYSPTSPNAQSGIAVAQAVAEVDKIYVGSGEMPEDCNIQIDPDGNEYFSETWKQITDFTLTDEAVINLTKDMSDNPISLKKFKVLAELPEVTTATVLYLKINNILSATTPNSTATAKNPSYSIEAEYTFDWQFLTCVNNSNAYTNGTVNATPYGHRYSNGNIPFPCTSIGLSLNSAFTNGLPSGTRIRIWGVKA